MQVRRSVQDSPEVVVQVQDNNLGEHRSGRVQPSSYSRPLPDRDEQQGVGSHGSHEEEKEAVCSHAQPELGDNHSHSEHLSEDIAHNHTEDSLEEGEGILLVVVVGYDRSMRQSCGEGH